MKSCKKCGMKMDDNDKFCVRCGADNTDSNTQFEETSVTSPTVKKKNAGKVAAFIAGGVALALIGVIIGYFLASRAGEDAPVEVETTVAETTEAQSEEADKQEYIQDDESAVQSIDKAYNDGDSAKLLLLQDMQFVLIVNLYEGYGTITGVCEEGDDGVLDCRVLFKNYDGFSGDELDGFKLIPTDEGGYTIELNNVESVVALENGDVFTPEK